MKLGSMDPALICSGPMSTFSYDSHAMSRGRVVDELPRLQQDNKTDRYKKMGNPLIIKRFYEFSYNTKQMDLEIQRVARELYKAFSGLNDGFKEVYVNICFSLRKSFQPKD